jgi:pyruvate formate lyase activating enzyme
MDSRHVDPVEGSHHPARWWHRLEDGRVQCDLCPRDCRLHEGQRGACFVRARAGDAMVLTTWGRSSGFCLDPIEKKPLAHFYPGTSVLSFGTAGCNLACRFCQNWDLTKSRDMDRMMDRASPRDIARAAREAGARSVAYTYNDPIIFAEYAIDVAEACRAEGIANVAVTNGYIHAAPRREFYGRMDALNVDLKGFTDEFYVKLTGARLAPVLDSLVWIARESRAWLEITTLLIPGQNDSDEEIARECRWILGELGPDVPLHFSAFHPDFRMMDVPPTPAATLRRARAIALAEGIRYAYTGNVHDREGDTTRCPCCGAALVQRDWYRIEGYRLTEDGRCPDCGTAIPGRWQAFDIARQFGPRRIPVAIGGAA